MSKLTATLKTIGFLSLCYLQYLLITGINTLLKMKIVRSSPITAILAGITLFTILLCSITIWMFYFGFTNK